MNTQTIRVNVVMLAFQPTTQIYPLDVPVTEDEKQKLDDYVKYPERDDSIVYSILDQVFLIGNRDERPYGKLFCSVSAGDIVLLGSDRWFCSHVGWKKITVEEMHAYCAMDRRERHLSNLFMAGSYPASDEGNK